MKQEYLLLILLPLLIILLNLNFIIFHNNNNTELNGNVLNYFQDKEELKYNFSNEEIIHLKEVKSLITKLNIIISILVIITTIILLMNKGRVLNQLVISGSIALFIILLLSLINFNSLFTKFHEALFSNDYWLLPSNSLLIQTYSFDFFKSLTKRLALNIIISSFVLIIIGIIQNVYSSYKSRSA